MRKPAFLLLALVAVSSTASAQRRYYRYEYDRNEISVGGGVQLDATGWEPAGMKLFFEYARRVGPHGAVVFQANPLVVTGVYDGPCHRNLGPCPGGFTANGYSFDLLFGGKWRWHARNAPVLGTFDLTFGAVPLWARAFDDNGVAIVGRAGGGMVILLARHVGLRFDAHMLAGPEFVGYWRCNNCGDIHPYVAFDTGVMVEFIF
jgi:hypothetical protein